MNPRKPYPHQGASCYEKLAWEEENNAYLKGVLESFYSHAVDQGWVDQEDDSEGMKEVRVALGLEES